MAVLSAYVAAPALAADDEVVASLGLGDDETELTSSHFPRPASKIAENVTVVTAEEIERLNAHTLAEVLQTVSGFQLDQVRTPGSWGFFSINGTYSGDGHILVMIDGVPQNFLAANNTSAEIGLIPVQQIERVEIIKGAASTAWGPALGGVINVITKSPDPERRVAGTASASIGSSYTTDLHGELTGTIDRFGYYLTGGNLHSDGLNQGNWTKLNHFFGKFTYDLPTKGTLTLGLDYRDSSRGLEESIPFDIRDSSGSYYGSSYLNFSYPLADRLNLELTGRLGHKEMWTKWGFVTIPDLLADIKTQEDSWGTGIRLNWGDAERNLVFGMEYVHDSIKTRDPLVDQPYTNFDRKLDRYDVYLNGAYSLGPLTILPGVRYDYTGLDDNAFSYTLGATYKITDKTLLRAYGARGYSMPLINFQNKLQQIWTMQGGFETAEIPYLWLKGTLFQSDTWHIENDDNSNFPDVLVTLTEQKRRGFELEAHTSPVYGAYLTAGYTYAEVRDATTDERPSWIPTNGLKLALNYDNKDIGLRGALIGNYIHWPSSAGPVKEGGLIWDLHLNQKLFPAKELSPELFFSARNLFDGNQYTNDLWKNNPRWFEGGVRFKF
ncbi:vitamin B12 transporter BtuB [Geobacter sp. OR-1]|uniref:TonB-dependent receptor plug domain-containing protein n=1 Tax=Geobacter sp. OR-1 TaxID=1266765 RepID=UPI000541F09F|nr:TonB-dependent receptor plug domain-containing protein [Geobacter sp. OR-1]GAM07969.1 vitamin B12 transporter BtuB [Geobacter sp. OR-1]